MVNYRQMSERLRTLTRSKMASRVSVLSKEIGELVLYLATSWARCFGSICNGNSWALEKVQVMILKGGALI
jgi:hypothetical protein